MKDLTQGEKTLRLEVTEIENFLNKEEKYDIINLEKIEKILAPEELNKISSLTNDGGKVNISLSESNLSTEEINKQVGNLKLAGFLKVSLSEDKNISGTKKAWNKNKNKKSENPWKAMKIGESSDLVVEDELIDPFDSYQKFAKVDDCITKPKPCKNCNCGRAEQENKQGQVNVDPNFKSDCGKCYLGDAFRCAGCPYRGKPAFEPGDKIEFNTALGDTEIVEETSNFNIKDKTVKIDI
jgi:hypothetical protein